jgi:hypothetical protein
MILLNLVNKNKSISNNVPVFRENGEFGNINESVIQNN